MIYQWKNGNHVRGDAQVIGETLETLRQQRAGLLTPADVLEAGTSPASPLHACFEWEDSRAAHAFRLEQAGDVMRSVVVSVEKPSGEAMTVRAFVSVTDAESRRPAYTSVGDAMADPALRIQVVAQAKRDLRTWREKYHDLNEMADLFSAIDRELIAA